MQFYLPGSHIEPGAGAPGTSASGASTPDTGAPGAGTPDTAAPVSPPVAGGRPLPRTGLAAGLPLLGVLLVVGVCLLRRRTLTA